MGNEVLHVPIHLPVARTSPPGWDQKAQRRLQDQRRKSLAVRRLWRVGLVGLAPGGEAMQDAQRFGHVEVVEVGQAASEESYKLRTNNMKNAVICVYLYIYIYMYVCVCICMSICMYVCNVMLCYVVLCYVMLCYVCMYVGMSVCLSVCMYVYLYVCMYVCVCMYV